MGAMIAVIAGQGVIRNPVSTTDLPRVCWKKNGRATNAIPWAANAAIAVADDNANCGRRNRSTGSIGAGCPFCARSSTTASIAATTNSGTTGGSVPPASTSATTPNGTLTANSQGHGPTDRIIDATVGPIANAVPTIIAF